jgi:DNA primase
MIPESFIQEILNRIDVVDVVDQRVKLKKAGANYVACCPFHQEKSPSFTVSPSKQFYHCFGCGAHGSAISFLMEYDGLTFIESVQSIANQLGLAVPNDQPNTKKDTADDFKLEEILKKANQHFKKNLRSSDLAINYLKKRGLTGTVAREFQIGYASDDWQGLKKEFENYEEPKLQTAGLVQKNDSGKIYDRFRNRIIFPIINAKSNIIGFGGRVINSEDQPKYYNSPETPLFKKSYEVYGLPQAKKGIRDDKNILIVEGYMDVISLYQHGIQNAVATLGTATTIYHLKKLIRYSKKITFCFDGDNAGKEAAWKALNTAVDILEDDYEFYFLFLPEGEDPDTFIKTHSIQDFKKYIDHATPLTEFIVKRLTEKNDLSSQENKIKFINNFEPIYKIINANKYKIFLIKRVADLIHFSQREIEKMMSIEPTENFSVPPQMKYSRSSKNSLTAKRKYILILAMKPELFKSEDEIFFQNNLVEDELFKQIKNSMEENNSNIKNTASLFHSLQNKIDENILDELQRQMMDYSENIDLLEEFKGIQNSFNQQLNSNKQSQQFAALKNKKLSEFSDEEKEFLKNYKK